MPHVLIKCYPGKTEEQKKELAERITKDIEDVFGNKEASISITIKDVEKENWKEVYDEAISDDATLYKKPGYKM